MTNARNTNVNASSIARSTIRVNDIDIGRIPVRNATRGATVNDDHERPKPPGAFALEDGDAIGLCVFAPENASVALRIESAFWNSRIAFSCGTRASHVVESITVPRSSPPNYSGTVLLSRLYLFRISVAKSPVQITNFFRALSVKNSFPIDQSAAMKYGQLVTMKCENGSG